MDVVSALDGGSRSTASVSPAPKGSGTPACLALSGAAAGLTQSYSDCQYQSGAGCARTVLVDTASSTVGCARRWAVRQPARHQSPRPHRRQCSDRRGGWRGRLRSQPIPGNRHHRRTPSPHHRPLRNSHRHSQRPTHQGRRTQRKDDRFFLGGSQGCKGEGATLPQRVRGYLLDETGAVGRWSTSARIKGAGLPGTGSIRYVPPTNYRPGAPLPRGTRTATSTASGTSG